MTTSSRIAHELQLFFRQNIPLAEAAGIEVDAYTGDQLIVSAPLDKNINDKGMAFGGSLYNVCVICGWGMAHLKAEELGLTGQMVISKAEISYLKPLVARLVATAQSPDPEQLSHFKQAYQKRGRAAVQIEVTMLDEQQQPCVHFVGKYAVLAPVSEAAKTD